MRRTLKPAMRTRRLSDPPKQPIFRAERRTDMGLIQNLRKRLRAPSIEEVELAYLNGSTSQQDLEMRMREIDRGRFRRPAYRGW